MIYNNGAFELEQREIDVLRFVAGQEPNIAEYLANVHTANFEQDITDIMNSIDGEVLDD